MKTDEKRATRKIANGELKRVAEALNDAGSDRIPIQLAMRMVKQRRAIGEHLQAVDEVRAGIVQRIIGDDRGSIDKDHPQWGSFVDEVNELFSEEFEIVDVFELYHRTAESGEDEYSWTTDFKNPIQEISPNTLFGLLEVVEIVEVEQS